MILTKAMDGTYDIDLSACTNVTAEIAMHLEANGWSANDPDYVYENVAIWEGGMGTNLFRDNLGQYFVND